MRYQSFRWVCLLLVACVLVITNPGGGATEPAATTPRPTPASGDRFPPGWETSSPREEIRPKFSYNPSGGPKQDGGWVITADDREGLHGWFQKSFPVTGGKHYRFEAVRKVQNVAVPRRSVVARVVWQDEAGKPVPLSEAPAKGYLTGYGGAAEPEHPTDKGTDARDWTEVSDTYHAPAKACRAVVELHLLWAPGGRVEWAGVSFAETAAPAGRAANLLRPARPPDSDRPANEGRKEDKKAVKTVAVLLFDGVELLDFTGPAEVFIVADHGKSFRVVTVADSTKPLKTMGGITITPDFSYENAPRADVLVVPGGKMSAVGKEGRTWLKKAAGDADIVMSVCFGAFLLADAGLLDGGEATTHHWGLDDLKKIAPKCKVVEGKRFVDNGKVITTAGVTAGIDGALRVVERLLGKDAARWTAEEWMEHHREPFAPK